MSMKPAYSVKMLDAQSADETKSTVIGPGLAPNSQEHVFYAEWSTGVSAGVVEIEEAPYAEYSGTWVGVATLTYSAGSPIIQVSHKSGCYMALRARISTAVAGGTVTVHYCGN